MIRRLLVPIFVLAFGVAGCESSATPAASSSAGPGCRATPLVTPRVGERRTFRVTASSGRVSREQLVLRAHRGASYIFRRTRSGRQAEDEVYTLRDCAVGLPVVHLASRHGITEIITGLTLPALSKLGDGMTTHSTATLTATQGSKRAHLPVAETVTGKGRGRITVPAGVFQTQIIDLEYEIDVAHHELVERTRYWVTAKVGTVRAKSSATIDGVHKRGATVELVSAH